MKFLEDVLFICVISKTYQLLNLKFLCENYIWGSEKGVIVLEFEGRILEGSQLLGEEAFTYKNWCDYALKW